MMIGYLNLPMAQGLNNPTEGKTTTISGKVCVICIPGSLRRVCGKYKSKVQQQNLKISKIKKETAICQRMRDTDAGSISVIKGLVKKKSDEIKHQQIKINTHIKTIKNLKSQWPTKKWFGLGLMVGSCGFLVAQFFDRDVGTKGLIVSASSCAVGGAIVLWK